MDKKLEHIVIKYLNEMYGDYVLNHWEGEEDDDEDED